MGDTCRKPDCSWLSLRSLHDLKEPPPLLPNPELSGVGVILGFSITAYLTVALLIFHYLTVYDPHRIGGPGREYTNPVDDGLIKFVRGKLIRSWKPSRRYEYAMEKSVLILSDTQLVTGLAILIAGYSQLSCGITSYHWQIMVYVAWFSSFTFLSAMAFLEGFFLANNSLRLIRVFFMGILGALQIAALLPTGSRNWLDAAREAGPLYPGLSTECFYEQLSLSTYSKRGPRMWSMVFSVMVVVVSYVHTGIRLFDPTAEFSRKYFRAVPGSYVKRLLYFMEVRALRRGIRATIWTVPYLIVLAGYASVRAMYDIAESMLGEIIWLTFAIAWGTLKVWDTRALAWATQLDNGDIIFKNTYNDDDTWSFGQILPMVLLLLPILSMFQSYLDNDAKAQDAINPAPNPSTTQHENHLQTAHLAAVRPGTGTEDEGTPITPITPITPKLTCITGWSYVQPSPTTPSSHAGTTDPFSPPHLLHSESQLSSDPGPNTIVAPLPRYPFHSFISHPWYRDHLYLLVCQVLMIGGVIMWVQGALVSILGISYILRSRLFIIGIFGFVPLASIMHLASWFLAASIVRRIDGAEEWLSGTGKYARRGKGWWKLTRGRCVYYLLVFVLKAGLLAMTFTVSVQVAGPQTFVFGNG